VEVKCQLPDFGISGKAFAAGTRRKSDERKKDEIPLRVPALKV
jgi:hypothetical protein